MCTAEHEVLRVGDFLPESTVFGKSEVMQTLRGNMVKVAATNAPVVITGECGTGKDIIARMIHRFSLWKGGSFVKISCPGRRGTLLESELFGYEEGVSSCTFRSTPERVEMASGGTLFLDEILELDPSLQSKLLSLLQDGQLCAIGGQEGEKVEVRIVCATNRDLQNEVDFRTFRRDLFYRLNVVNLRVPSLRERRGDIESLAMYFLEYYNRKFNCETRPLSRKAVAALQEYRWPGNIRELENFMKRYVILGREEAITSHLVEREPDFLNPNVSFDGGISLKKLTRQAVRRVERKVILQALQQQGWNRREAARRLGISYRALLYRLATLGCRRTGNCVCGRPRVPHRRQSPWQTSNGRI